MSNYNPKAPNELADAQLKRQEHESDASKAVASKHHHNDENVDGKKPFEYGDTNKESYNSIPGE